MLETGYEALLDVSEGRIGLEEFAVRSTVAAGTDRVGEVLDLFGAALTSDTDRHIG